MFLYLMFTFNTFYPFISNFGCWHGIHKFRPSLPHHQSNILRFAINGHMTLCFLTKKQWPPICSCRCDFKTIGGRPKLKSSAFHLQNFLASTSCPEIQGYLYVKELGRKSWKKVYMFLRRSGLYCSTKGTSKVTEARTFHLQRAELISIQQALSVLL